VACEVGQAIEPGMAHLNRQTEQLNQRVQGAEQHVKSLDQRASQAPLPSSPAQAALPSSYDSPDQVPDQVKQPETTSRRKRSRP